MIARRITAAFRFLTIVPIGKATVTSERELAESLSYFPLIGFIQGIGMLVLALILLKVMAPSVVSIFVLAFYIFVTGGFHQDGLSDTFDALSIKSSDNPSKDRERRLRIMKDSTTGPMGVIAIVVTLLMKYALLESILDKGLIGVCAVLLLLPVVSKWAMVIGMYRTRPAAPGGLGGFFLERIKLKYVGLATVLLCCLVIVTYTFVYSVSGSLQLMLTVLLLLQILVVFVVNLIWKHVFTKQFGGLTGDNFGTLHESAEITYLTLAVLFI